MYVFMHPRIAGYSICSEKTEQVKIYLYTFWRDQLVIKGKKSQNQFLTSYVLSCSSSVHKEIRKKRFFSFSKRNSFAKFTVQTCSADRQAGILYCIIFVSGNSMCSTGWYIHWYIFTNTSEHIKVLLIQRDCKTHVTPDYRLKKKLKFYFYFFCNFLALCNWNNIDRCLLHSAVM